MGHFCTTYGYLEIHHTEYFEAIEYIEESKRNGSVPAKFIQGYFVSERSGFATFALAGEFKVYHDDNPQDFIKGFMNFLEPIKGIYCKICFDSEIGIYPPKVQFIISEGNWIEDNRVS